MKLSEKIQLRALLKKLCMQRSGTGDCVPGSGNCQGCHVHALLSELEPEQKTRKER